MHCSSFFGGFGGELFFGIYRPQWVSEKSMQDIGQKQLLVLLFVICTQFDPLQSFRISIALEQALNGLVHVFPIAQNLVERRAGKRRPETLFGESGKALVIAVE